MLSIDTTSESAVPELSGRMPEEVFAPFSNEKGAMLLLSGGTIDADYSYICLDPALLLIYREGETYLDIHTEQIPEKDPLDFIDRFTKGNRDKTSGNIFTGGAVGYISYGYRT